MRENGKSGRGEDRNKVKAQAEPEIAFFQTEELGREISRRNRATIIVFEDHDGKIHVFGSGSSIAHLGLASYAYDVASEEISRGDLPPQPTPPTDS